MWHEAVIGYAVLVSYVIVAVIGGLAKWRCGR